LQWRGLVWGNWMFGVGWGGVPQYMGIHPHIYMYEAHEVAELKIKFKMKKRKKT
jgi:hypothetical protein